MLHTSIIVSASGYFFFLVSIETLDEPERGILWLTTARLRRLRDIYCLGLSSYFLLFFFFSFSLYVTMWGCLLV
ncbi:hypothetical protein F4775DRAFT_542129 [Biscogniauxia sp. FL1348]|nr:hypothetical protein F4775DRAFT_542129 [Biscogniauxia sp. FL1348]